MVSTGFSEVIGSWKIIAMSRPRISRISSSVRSRRFAALEQDAAGDDAPGGPREQPHDGERGHRLAAAGFADERHRLAGPDLVGDAFDRAHHAARRHEVDVQVLDFEQPLARAGSGRGRAARYRSLIHLPHWDLESTDAWAAIREQGSCAFSASIALTRSLDIRRGPCFAPRNRWGLCSIPAPPLAQAINHPADCQAEQSCETVNRARKKSRRSKAPAAACIVSPQGREEGKGKAIT